MHLRKKCFGQESFVVVCCVIQLDSTDSQATNGRFVDFDLHKGFTFPRRGRDLFVIAVIGKLAATEIMRDPRDTRDKRRHCRH